MRVLFDIDLNWLVSRLLKLIMTLAKYSVKQYHSDIQNYRTEHAIQRYKLTALLGGSESVIIQMLPSGST